MADKDKRADRPLDKLLDSFDERLKSIDLEPAAAPAPPSFSSPGGGNVDLLRRKLEEAEAAIEASASTRRETFHDLTTLIDARLASFSDAAPSSGPAPVALPLPPLLPQRPSFDEVLKKTQERLAAIAPLPAARPAPSPAPPAHVAAPPAPVAAVPVEAPVAPAPQAPLPSVPPPQAAAPAPRKAPRLSATAAAVVAASLIALPLIGVLTSSRRTSPPAEFALNSPRAVGLSLSGGQLLTLDPDRQLLYLVDASNGEISGVQKFAAASDVVGAAHGKDRLWTITSSGKLRQYALAGDHELRRTFDPPSLKQGGPLYWDGQSLWIGGPEEISLYSVGDTLTLLRRFELPRVRPAGLQAWQGTLWVLDATTRKALRYRLAENLLQPLGAAELPALGSDAVVAAGLAVDDSWLWIATDKPGMLHRFALKSVAAEPR